MNDNNSSSNNSNNNNNNHSNNNNNNNSNHHNNKNTASGYRTIIPAPSPTATPSKPQMIPSPHHSPQVHPNPQHTVQHGITLPPPFRTPPVSPFSHPMNNALPPPLPPLPPIMPTVSKQQGPITSVFSVPMTPSNASSVMHHHTSVIHPYHHHHNVQHRMSVSGAATGNGAKPLTTADQRELARKVSHSAIERRRREKINDKIMQLKELIPSCADQDHLHKLSILQSAIEYIQYLQGCVLETRKRGGSSGDSEERITKKSKFDRYEIPIPKNINDTPNNSKNKDDRKITDDSGKSKNKEEECVDHEEANALSPSSKSSKDTNTNSDNVVEKNIPKTINVEIQTSPKEIIKDDEENTPSRSAMTVQQLLC